MSDGKTSLYAKLAAVTAELGYVTKDGKNEFQGYRYTSAEALLAAVRGPLSAHGIVVMPSLTALGEREYTTSKGKASVITTARVKFTLVDGETGERHESEWAGQGDDPADKGLGKAYTNAIKTFLREQFLIPQGDDPEADRATDERGADRAPVPANGHVPTASAQDVERLHEAAGGLPGSKLRLAFAAAGIDIPEPFDRSMFDRVPQAKVAGFADTLAKVERSK